MKTKKNPVKKFRKPKWEEMADSKLKATPHKNLRERHNPFFAYARAAEDSKPMPRFTQRDVSLEQLEKDHNYLDPGILRIMSKMIHDGRATPAYLAVNHMLFTMEAATCLQDDEFRDFQDFMHFVIANPQAASFLWNAMLPEHAPFTAVRQSMCFHTKG
ncbi:MAG: hypothetical protein FWD61_18975 [Phycisphaerales bacterium]|nr:hypothetical protein [Phycisphaerales bacterium]